MSDEEAKAKERGPYKRRTDAELEQLAQDVIAGRVFTSVQIDNPHDIRNVFMLLLFLDPSDLDWMKEHGISLFYEYMSEATPRSINGYPCFMSLKYLDREDHEKLGKRHDEIKSFMDSRKVPT